MSSRCITTSEKRVADKNLSDVAMTPRKGRIAPVIWRRITSRSLTSKRLQLDNAGSALTGRHLPAAREDSHLFD